jgi:hypothetical protein
LCITGICSTFVFVIDGDNDNSDKLEEKTGQEKLNTQLVKELGCDTK